VSAGWPPDRAWNVLTDPRNTGSEALRQDRHGKPRRRPRLYFERAWGAAEKHVAAYPPLRDRASVLVELVNVREAVFAASWPGRGGATDQAILLALVDIAIVAGRLRIHASVRALAVETGVSPTTAATSLKRLRRGGWISNVARATTVRAAVWQIRRRPPTEHSGYGETVNPDRHADAFCWKALGLSCGRVYGALSAEPVATSDLAKSLGMSDRSGRRHLARLAEYDLAKRGPEGWTRGESDPAEVARLFGTAGRQEERRERYAQERERRRASFDHLPADPITGEVRTLPGHSGLPTGGVSRASSRRPYEEEATSA
jgi:hypothetical protein